MAELSRCTIIPTLRYRDANAAIEFLCNAFGFDRHLVVPGPDNTVAHAQLRFGNGMIMLGSASNEGDYGNYVRPPQPPDRINTQGLYIVVTDADAHCAQAKAGGAEILRPPADQDYGGRDYTCRDLEGHIWSFGTYDPWM